MTITMDELLERLLGSASETNRKIEDLGNKMEEKILEVVKEAVDPLKTRLATVETSIAKMNGDMSDFQGEVTKDIADFRRQLHDLKTAKALVPEEEESSPEDTGGEAEADAPLVTSWATVSSRRTPPTSTVTSPGGDKARQRRMFLEVSRRRKIGLNKEMTGIMEKAGRTIAFCPIQEEEVKAIEKEMEEDHDNEGANVREEAMRKAISEYLVGEMKMTNLDCTRLSITEVFAPRYKDYRTVYAVFSTLEEAEKVLSMCLYLRSTNRVTNHVPWRARDRQNAVEGRAKQYRDRGYRTRISIRDSDYLLLVKHKVEAGGWRPATDMENLPPFSNAQSVRSEANQTSPGQAGGRVLRVGLKKHPRSPASEKAEVPEKKRVCQSEHTPGEEVTINDCEDEDEEGVTHSSVDLTKDRGYFVSIQSASPAKAKVLRNRRGQMTRELMNLR